VRTCLSLSGPHMSAHRLTDAVVGLGAACRVRRSLAAGQRLAGAALAIAGLALLASCGDQHRDGLTAPPWRVLEDASPSTASLTIAWSPSGSYDFGAVEVGLRGSQTFTLTNTQGPRTGQLSVSLTGSANFSITSDACTGTALGKGKSCDVTVQYAPSVVGETATATLTASGRKPGAATITLSGNGVLVVATFISGTLTTQVAAGAFATVSSDLTAPLGVVGSGSSLDLACDPLTTDLTGKIAVVGRGTCSFSTKIRNAQNAGATAVIVVNNTSGLRGMDQDGTPNQPTVPAYMALQSEGVALIVNNGRDGTIGAALTTIP